MDAQRKHELQQLAERLLGVALYIVWTTDNAKPTLPDAWGVNGPLLDLNYENYLIARGEWAGRRACVFVDDRAIWQSAMEEVGGDESLAEPLASLSIIAVLIHEIGHVADRGVDTIAATVERRQFAHSVAAYSIRHYGSDAFPPMFGHRACWLRCTLHAAYRAAEAGYTFNVDWLYNGALGIAPASEFLSALDDEPRCFVRARIGLFDVNRFAMPLNFQRLWNHSIARWVKAQPAECEAVDHAIALLLR